MSVTLGAACGNDSASVGVGEATETGIDTIGPVDDGLDGTTSGSELTGSGGSAEGGSTDGGSTGGSVDEPKGTNVLLQIVGMDGTPIGKALITVDGVEHFADGAGFILFDSLPDGRFTARVDAPGFTSAVVGLDVGEGSGTHRQVKLFPLGPALPFDADIGGKLEFDGVSVEIPPYALIDRNGDHVTGMVEVTITSLDPTGNDLEGLPGPLEGVSALGEEVTLLSTAMTEISLWQAGRPLNLAPGAMAQIELEVPAALEQAVQPGDDASGWALYLEEGVWREDTVGTVMVDDDDRKFWRAEVDHFTWWNNDWPTPLTECYYVTLVDQNGDFIPNQSFWINSMISDPALAAEFGGAGVLVDGGISLDAGLLTTSNCAVAAFGTTPELNVPGLAIEQDLPPSPGIPGTCKTGTCTEITVVVDVPPPIICTPGATVSCGYSGPPSTEDVGICQGATDYCIDGGTAWSGCLGEVLPVAETCTTIFDDDCNGVVNDSGALDCVCSPGDTLGCYGGPLGTEGVGLCVPGLRSCVPVLNEYGPCAGDVTPIPEDCVSPVDENCNGISGCEGEAQWASNAGGGLLAQGRDVAVSSLGDVYTVGYFDDWIDFGGGPLVSTGSSDMFLVKQDAAGVTQWSKRIGGTGADLGLSVFVDGSGNVLVTGVISDTVNVDGVNNIVTAGDGDILVAKFDANGLHQWSTSFGGPGYDGGFGIVSNATGDVFVTGTASGDVFAGVPGIGASDAFIIALDGNSGALAWARAYGGSTSAGLDIDVGPGGNLLATGYFNLSIDFGAGALLSAGDTDVFVVELDASNGYAHDWSARFGGPLADAGNAISIDPATGDAYLAGRYSGAVDFGGGPLANAGSRDTFLVALDTNGGHRWSQGWGGPFSDDGLGVAVGAGGVVVTGRFIGAVDFGGGIMNSVGNVHDIMLVKLDTGGLFEWAQRFGAAGDDTGMGVVADAINIYLTGYFTNDVDFGSGTLLNPSGTDMVTAKYVP